MRASLLSYPSFPHPLIAYLSQLLISAWPSWLMDFQTAHQPNLLSGLLERNGFTVTVALHNWLSNSCLLLSQTSVTKLISFQTSTNTYMLTQTTNNNQEIQKIPTTSSFVPPHYQHRIQMEELNQTKWIPPRRGFRLQQHVWCCNSIYYYKTVTGLTNHVFEIHNIFCWFLIIAHLQMKVVNQIWWSISKDGW